MTETFAIGRPSVTSPFREESLTELEELAPPVEPEFAPPGEDLVEAEEAFLGGSNADQAIQAFRAALLVQGQSRIAVQANKQWNGPDRPSQWIGNVYGLVVHTTGGDLPAEARALGIHHTVHAINHYNRPDMHGCHYVNGWLGAAGGDLLQIANERERARGVNVDSQRSSINQGRFEKDLPAVLVAKWRARWPGVEHSLRLLPGTKTANSCYVHLECVPCVYRGETHATPMRPGLRFTRAQHEAVALLACDVARRNGWPLRDTWWRTPRLLGHEDLSPITRHTKTGGWDPGALRTAPWFDWEFVYSMIERECRAGAAAQPVPARASWPFEDEAQEAKEEDELEQELDQPAELSEPEWEQGESDDREDDKTEPEAEGPGDESAYDELADDEAYDDLAYDETVDESAYDDSGPVEESEAELETETEDEAESIFLEPVRVAMAVARGERNEDTLTNDVFFARYPARGRTPIGPDEKDLAAEWLGIRDRLVRPLLARAARPATGGSAPAGLPPGPFGTLTLNAPGRRRFSYRFTAEDALWTAKLVTLEAGGRADSASAAVVWAMFNRYALVRHTLYPTFHSFIRAYSTTLQPVLLNWKAAQRHLGSPEFVPSGGTYTTKGAPPGIPKGQLRRHLDFQARPWARIGGPARSLTLDALRGSLPNPGIGMSSEFVSTRILWMQANKTKREPTDQEWRSFTETFPSRVQKPYAWIGDVPDLDQRKNAFFRYLSDAGLPAGAVTVTP